MDQTREELIFTDKLTSEDSPILGVLEGYCADFIDSTRNGRHYSEKLWDKVFNHDPIVDEMFKNGGIPGEMDHPADREETDSARIAILMKEKPIKKNGKFWAKFHILNTPLGKIAYTLAKAGFHLGISSRGSGEVIETPSGDEVDESSYDFKTFDLVLVPSVKAARLALVTEGLDQDKKISLNESLDKLLESASEKDKELMEEVINHLNLREGDILSKVCNNFGILEEPYLGPTYILPSGKFLDIRNLGRHSAVEKWLIDNGLSNETYNESTGSPSLKKLGCIRCDTLKYYMSLCEILPTSEQYNSLLLWMDCLQHNRSNIVEVITPDGLSITYTLKEIIPDYIVDRIRRYYTSGVLYEKLNLKHLHEFVYDRMPAGDPIAAKSLNESKDWTPEEIKQASELMKKSGWMSYDEFLDFIKKHKDKIEDKTKEEKTLDDNTLDALKLTLSSNKELQDKNSELQEKLTECYANESKLQERISSLILEVSKLKKERINASQLTEELNSLRKDSSEKDELINEMLLKVDSIQNKAKSLVEKYQKSLTKLSESTDEISEKNNCINKLNEQLNTLKSDYQLLLNKYTRTIEKTNTLVENYKAVTNKAIDKYIESQALKLGCTSNEIKNKLQESYTFKDIDSVCSLIEENRFGMNRLSYIPSSNILTEGCVKKATVILTQIKKDRDDDIDNLLSVFN